MCANHQHDTASETSASEASAPEAPAPEAAASSCCGHTATAPAAAPVAVPAAPGQDDVAECPVMPGSVVDKAAAEAAGLYRDYEGNRYWLCCDACGPMWDADPAKYAAA